MWRFFVVCLPLCFVLISGNCCNEQKNIVTFSVFLQRNIPKHCDNNFTEIVPIYISPLLIHMQLESLFQESVMHC